MMDQVKKPFEVTVVEVPGIAGPKGEVPDIQVTAISLPAGSEATAERSGTAEEPLITFGIPEGVGLDSIGSIPTENINNLFGV